ncbi:type II secretion system protein GspM [Microbulbifer yueqingensis]|uniref:General secretion pathway protein M n=1 Tax=Microbulbifer yueqingensis TaxID=658219 RepID=A0A1G8ZXY4_9GAMM|nr:type II secretion system protein M [Microbulbifer yueqingensis]SDK19968.1 general secretion pathway protein M [Microbulbifer yueqingensis]
MKDNLEQFQRWWQALPGNDQRALGALSLFLGGLFLVYGLFLPAKHFFDGARAEAEASRELVSWIESQRPVLERIDPVSGAGTRESEGTLLQRVTAAADRHGITIKRFEPEGQDRIRLWIERARYEDLQPWFNTLIEQRFIIQTVNLDALPEEGMVSARLTLEG